jgi:hypothetical protein
MTLTCERIRELGQGYRRGNMATIKVNLTQVGDACEQDATGAGMFPEPGWYVFLNDCHNEPFIHAGKQYGPVPLDHGYCEIKDVPPGRYILFAILNPFEPAPIPPPEPVPGGVRIFQANYASHFAVVDVCCADRCHDVCVTLYNSGWHYCVRVLILWLQHLATLDKLDAQIVERAVTAMEAVVRVGGEPLPGDAAINRQIEELTRLFRRGEKTRE